MSITRRQKEMPGHSTNRLSQSMPRRSGRPIRRQYANALLGAYDLSEQFTLVSPLHKAAAQKFYPAWSEQVEQKETASKKSLWEISTDTYSK